MPERLIAGTGAGLALGIDAGDCACCVGGFRGCVEGFFRGAGCGNSGGGKVSGEVEVRVDGDDSGKTGEGGQRTDSRF